MPITGGVGVGRSNVTNAFISAFSAAYAKRVAEEKEERERSGMADALNRLADANPELASLLGGSTTQTIQREGAMAEPEAAGTPAPIQTTQVPHERVTPAEAPTVKSFLEERMKTTEATRLAKDKPEEGVLAGPGQQMLGKQTGRKMGEPIPIPPSEEGGEPEDFWRYNKTFKRDKYGRNVSVWEKRSDKYITAADDLVFNLKMDPRSPEFAKAMQDHAAGVTTTPKGAFRTSDITRPTGKTEPEAVIPAERPVSIEGATTIAGAMRAREAAQEMTAQLKMHPELTEYMGKLQQFRGTGQRWGVSGQRLLKSLTGVDLQMVGLPPAAFTAFEQNLNELRNYTIRLITGAQMNKEEVPRIEGQIPVLGMDPREFPISLAATLRENEKMEQRVITLALNGNKTALDFAKAEGIKIPNLGPSPAGVSGQKPTGTPTKPAPTSQTLPKPTSPSGAAVPHFESPGKKSPSAPNDGWSIKRVR